MQEEAEPEVDLLCEYSDRHHEELCSAMLGIYVDTHPSLSRERDPLPNEAARLSMRIYENLYQWTEAA